MKTFGRICIISQLFTCVILSHSQADQTMITSKGIGPVKEVKLGTVDAAMSVKGKSLFTAKCSACHKMEERYVGPALKGVTGRRPPEWIMNMILNPAEMITQDETAKELLAEYMTQMAFQNVSQDDARAILEYFREYEVKGTAAGGSSGATVKQEKPSKKTKK